MRYEPIPSILYADRRAGFVRKMKRDSMAIFFSPKMVTRTADQHFPFRQDSDLLCVSGLNQQSTIVVLAPFAREKKMREMAFILPQDTANEIWNGRRLTAKETTAISGIETVYPIKQFSKIIQPLLDKTESVYTNAWRSISTAMEDASRFDTEWSILYQLNSQKKYIAAASITNALRMIKHPLEIEWMRKAVDITSTAFQAAMLHTREGITEYELESVITSSLIRRGAHHAFDPIIAAGASACTLHYVRNDGILQKGTLVLLDFGAEYAGLAADMSRTIPVSGRFDPWQKKVYHHVLHILYTISDLMRPGITLSDLNKETGKLMDHALLDLGLLRRHDLRKQDPKQPARQKYFMHGVGHHLGYDVHDVYAPNTPLRAGMVITCEPGLYIKEKKTGIRLENDILVTRQSPQNLMKHVPLEAEEIETFMQDSMKDRTSKRS